MGSGSPDLVLPGTRGISLKAAEVGSELQTSLPLAVSPGGCMPPCCSLWHGCHFSTSHPPRPLCPLAGWSQGGPVPAAMPGCRETLWGQLLLGQIRRKAGVDQTNPRGPSHPKCAVVLSGCSWCHAGRSSTMPQRTRSHPGMHKAQAEGTVLQGRS